MDGSDRIIVVGAGIAGLATALRLAAPHAPLKVTLISAGTLGTEAATAWAQGGIAAALDPDDHPNLHAIDTLKAGAGLSEPVVAHLVAGGAGEAIGWLETLGAPFDRDAAGRIALGLEAAHSRRRIAHAGGDATGREVLKTLIRAALTSSNIEIRDHTRLTGLMRDGHGRIAGVSVERAGERIVLHGRAVVLATGGLGGLYASTTNPLAATGLGLACAAQAGAVLRDMEFVQFHPTAIAVERDGGPAEPPPMALATEALRGEGAVLLNDAGERFMLGTPGAELAPRDVVARGIFAQIAAGHRVVLDARLPDLERRFPSVVALCRTHGVDPVAAPIPVRPAAHYHMGGVEVDLDARTSLPGLYAVGEVASTGLHGANRLASNSLLEALVFGSRAALAIAGEAMRPVAGLAPATPAPRPSRLDLIRPLMDDKVGVVRDAVRLREAIDTLARQAHDGTEPAATVALMVARGALAREESRGGHFRADAPQTAASGLHARITLAETLPARPEPQVA
ncbi:L-aspartate oxidase [Ancylobacter sp. 6x-1]|uniref:L-aspartate oxidase n=1 Tax=Ancylobacter crimeensis TaxID=2579147 RepID=A0ABT0DFE0_9HYPH|nr:L-aspartate oxidase [Ancylobacter crimeensis]MCK0198689.1 L-aspartate oxidase [Ancylobacter crimeensis]